MKDIKRLLKENNQMLKKICAWIDEISSTNHQTELDAKDFIINVAADLFVEGLENKKNGNKN